MSSVDDRVVSVDFETSKFQSGVATVLSGLDKLKNALQFPNAGKGLNEVDAAAKKVDLSHIASAVDTIKERFTALKLVAVNVLSNIATQVVRSAGNFVKTFTLQPVIQGFKEYETGLNAVQTILSNTQAAGTKLKDVNKTLNELNHYADKTIYNFSEMTRNIGTFTAAGVDLKTASASIKGIANLAALSGSNSQQASTAMYQLSQAISAGRVTLQDWNSVVNAGMGGTVFQRALAQTAEHMGTLSKGSVELTGKMKNVTIAGESFRNSISAKPGEESWLTSKVLTTTLKQLSGDMTDAQLKAQGYSDAQIKAIQTQAKMALEAATQVKTLSQLLDTTKEAIGSGWAQTWQLVFGDFGEAKTLFTGLSNAISGFVGASADARNKVLKDWKELGGRTALIDGIKNAFHALIGVVTPIKEAFREIFPPTTGKQLYDLTVRFRDFMGALKMGPETTDNLKRTFAGFFALLDIGKEVIFGVIRTIAKLFGVVAEGSGGFLGVTANVGDFIVAIDKAIKKGDGLTKFFDVLGSVLEVPIRLVKLLASALAGLFDGIDEKDSAGISKSLDGIGKNLSPLEALVNAVKRAFAGLGDVIQALARKAAPLVNSIADAFGGLADAIGKQLSSANFDNVLEVIQVGLLGGIAVMIKKFFSGGFQSAIGSFGGGILQNISDSFDAITGSLQAMQQNIKADTLKKIAISIGILTASVVALSMVDSQALNKALSAMAIGFGQLLGAMAILTNVSKSAGFLKVPFIASSMIMLATAIGILTLAVRNLATLDWNELGKGLTGVAALLVIMSKAAGPLSKNSAGMITAGVGITAIAIAMKVLASAIADFGSLSWTEIGKGMASVAAALVTIGLAAKLFPSGMIAIGLGLVGVATGLKILASAVGDFGGMNWKVIGKGILSIAAAMVTIGLAMSLMPPNMVVTAAGLLLVAVALKGIGAVLENLGGMSVGSLAKGIISLAAALAVLGVAMYAMTGTLAGAAALAIAAASISLLAPALTKLGQQSWGEIVKGLVSLAAALAIMGVAATLLTPVVPAMLGMGAALTLIGAGMALAGAGIFLLGAGLSAIAVSGPAAIRILISGLNALVTAVPMAAINFVKGLLGLVDMIAAVAPRFMTAFVKILITVVDAVIVVSPKLEKAMIALLTAALNVIDAMAPRIMASGFRLLMALLDGIKNNIGQVVTRVTDIVITILNTLSQNMPRITQAGAEALAALLKGIANNIRTVISAAVDVVLNFVRGVSEQYGRVLNAGVDVMKNIVSGITSYFNKMVSTGVSAIVQFIEGVSDRFANVVKAGKDAAIKLVNAVGSESVAMAREGADAIIKFVNGVADAIRDKAPQLRAAGANLASAIMSGLLGGLNGSAVVNKMTSIAKGALGAAKRALHIKSPSRAFMEVGEAIMEGWAIGMENEADAPTKAFTSSIDSMVDAAAKALSSVPNNLLDMRPTITPVLDLTQAQSGANELGGMFNVIPISAAASYNQASAISAAGTVQSSMDADVVAAGGTQINFEQNNYSPEALSTADIYRQTKNQVSQVKTALELV